VSLFIIFKIPAGSVEADQLDLFLKETVLTLEVAITETARQIDPLRREKFEGTIVHTATVSEDAERIKEQIEDHWLIAWNLSVPISILPELMQLTVEHGRSRIVNPRVALTAILSLTPPSPEPNEEYITADSWEFLAGQTNLLAPLADDPTLSTPPVLTLGQITPMAIPQPQPRTKPGRRICRHIFPCGSPLDIRMRYNPLEPKDYSLSTEIVMLSVDLSVTPHAGASVLVKDVKVEMGGGTVTPMTEMQSTILKRYDVLTLLFRYERYGGDGGRKTVSTNATMVPLLSGSEETSPVIKSLWNKILDIPSLTSTPFAAPTQRAVSQIMTPSNSHRSSSSITGKPRGVQGHGRAHTVVDLPRPASIVSTTESSVLSITVEVPSKGVNPGDEFSVTIQVVNRARRPIKLALQADAQTGQSHARTQSRSSRTDKLLPRIPVSMSLPQPAVTSSKNTMTEAEVLEFYLQEREFSKTRGIYPLTVDGKIGFALLWENADPRTLNPGQVQSISCDYKAITAGIHEITGLRIVEIPTADTPPGNHLIINLSSCPSIVVHGGRY